MSNPPRLSEFGVSKHRGPGAHGAPGGAGGAGAGGISDSDLADVQGSENREYAMDGPQGEKAVNEIEDAAKKGNKDKIRDIQESSQMRAAAADRKNNQQANSMFSGIADYADDVLSVMRD